MSRTCSITNKQANNGYAVSHSHRRSKKLQHVNLQSKRIWNSKLKRWEKVKVSTKAIKKLIAL
uniref:ribosomal protein L28 n=1 Tax=Pseudoerythrocladia kornmannii TaxID=753682 RepID=UPI001BF053AB|nr:ribosomal protein L28 [Pseudoerythrocladia kornmannii]QUE28307.1 ribosomal protein L28 [Pseudoerythrocladia kornmannii]UNJ16811.1 ribosomal protein L28 [Pseudoerythrocladia kornmannii]